ncbi:hypothetical protein GCM10007941_08020 [Amphritea balenae]|nr:hypothetical protein GCM10007941_08020 [Amphritea balenae]
MAFVVEMKAKLSPVKSLIFDLVALPDTTIELNLNYISSILGQVQRPARYSYYIQLTY